MSGSFQTCAGKVERDPEDNCGPGKHLQANNCVSKHAHCKLQSYCTEAMQPCSQKLLTHLLCEPWGASCFGLEGSPVMHIAILFDDPSTRPIPAANVADYECRNSFVAPSNASLERHMPGLVYFFGDYTNAGRSKCRQWHSHPADVKLSEALSYGHWQLRGFACILLLLLSSLICAGRSPYRKISVVSQAVQPLSCHHKSLHCNLNSIRIM